MSREEFINYIESLGFYKCGKYRYKFMDSVKNRKFDILINIRLISQISVTTYLHNISDSYTFYITIQDRNITEELVKGISKTYGSIPNDFLPALREKRIGDILEWM